MKPSVRAGSLAPQSQGMKKASETPQIHLTASSTSRSSQHPLYTSSPAKHQTQEPLRKRRQPRFSACFRKSSDKEDHEDSESYQRAKRSGKKLVRMWRYRSTHQMARIDIWHLGYDPELLIVLINLPLSFLLRQVLWGSLPASAGSSKLHSWTYQTQSQTNRATYRYFHALSLAHALCGRGWTPFSVS